MFLFTKIISYILIYIADMANNFDIDQISLKLAKRWHFVYKIICKKILILGSRDNTENAKRQFFGDTQYQGSILQEFCYLSFEKEICSVSLKCLVSKILVFLLFSEVLEGLESSGRLIGRISTNFRQKRMVG